MKLKDLFKTEYRLTALYSGETEPRNTFGTDGRTMRKIARSCAADYWTLYKSGPLGLSERRIATGSKKGGIA